MASTHRTRYVAAMPYRSVPVDGLPLDLVMEFTRLTPEQIAEVGRLIHQIRHDTPLTVYTTYTPEDTKRIWKLVNELRART